MKEKMHSVLFIFLMINAMGETASTRNRDSVRQQTASCLAWSFTVR